MTGVFLESTQGKGNQGETWRSPVYRLKKVLVNSKGWETAHGANGSQSKQASSWIFQRPGTEVEQADSIGIESLTSADHFSPLHTVSPSSQTPREVVAWILQVRKPSSRGLACRSPGAGQTFCPVLLSQKASFRAGQLSLTELTAAP